jgi:pimeloyl-ACP methyl ester carboxylesterase
MRTHYVRSEGVTIAYRVSGKGDQTLLHVPGAVSNLAYEQTYPANAGYLERLGRSLRVVRFDKRGCGLSDRSVAPPTIDQQVPDVEAVRRAVGAERVALYGLSQGAAVAVLYAVAQPDRVTHLILVEGVCCDARNPYEPLSETNRLTDWSRFFADLERDFEAFTYEFAGALFPGVDAPVRESITELLQSTASPAVFESLWRGVVGFDLRPMLASVRAPTLVLHAHDDRHHPVAHGRYLAEHIPNARYLELDTAFHVPHLDERVHAQMLAAVEEFLTGAVRYGAERRLAAVLFTDVVGSTAEQRKRGEGPWRDLVERWNAEVRRTAEQFGGRLVEIVGDGALMEFPTAGEGLRAARALTEAARGLGLRIRAGLHAGEVYDVGGRLFGLCVNVAARVVAHAAADEVLTTETVRGLLEGSGLSFEDAGDFDLKGIGRRMLVRLR